MLKVKEDSSFSVGNTTYDNVAVGNVFRDVSSNRIYMRATGGRALDLDTRSSTTFGGHRVVRKLSATWFSEPRMTTIRSKDIPFTVQLGVLPVGEVYAADGRHFLKLSIVSRLELTGPGAGIIDTIAEGSMKSVIPLETTLTVSPAPETPQLSISTSDVEYLYRPREHASQEVVSIKARDAKAMRGNKDWRYVVSGTNFVANTKATDCPVYVVHKEDDWKYSKIVDTAPNIHALNLLMLHDEANAKQMVTALKLLDKTKTETTGTDDEEGAWE